MRLKRMRSESMLAQRPRQHAAPCPAPQQSGFALVAAMFVIIIIALVIAAMMRMAGNQHGTNSLAIQQARAYQAARSGLEWGISSALAGSCLPSKTLDMTGSNLSEFEGVLVTCSVNPYSENGGAVNIYQLTATAQNGLPGSRPDYAFRRLTAVVEN
jgi:MSHA biogenesis protein MshP